MLRMVKSKRIPMGNGHRLRKEKFAAAMHAVRSVIEDSCQKFAAGLYESSISHDNLLIRQGRSQPSTPFSPPRSQSPQCPIFL
jgi:hypothetical protein